MLPKSLMVMGLPAPPPAPRYVNVPVLVVSWVKVRVSEPLSLTLPLLLNVVETVKLFPFNVTAAPLLMVRLAMVTAVERVG